MRYRSGAAEFIEWGQEELFDMITPLQAARLIAMDYERDDIDPKIADRAIIGERLSNSGISAAIIEGTQSDDRILIIRGTDQALDWLRYNFTVFTNRSVEFGERCCWHTGFLNYARMCFDFAKDKKITQIIGHSLGAAAAQIVAPSLDVPCIAFASPRPLFGDTYPKKADRVVNYCRPDDLVTKLPPSFLGFNHIGQVNWLIPKSIHIGEDHRIMHYIELLETE
jgi:hypothetical protein